MIINPENAEPRHIYKLLIGCITPRPIAFVSSVSSDGVNNLAPYSFFTGVSANPPVIGFSPMINREQRVRDSRLNIEATGEFVVNVVSESIVEAMNETAVDVAPEVDEFELAGLTAVPADSVRAPLVAEAMISMECELFKIVEISPEPLGGAFVMGSVKRFHINDSIVDDYRIDPSLLKTVGRMGGNSYTRTQDRFDLERPQLKPTPD